MFYLTGDTHGKFGRIDKFCRINRTTKDDVMIILGDAGINYYLGLKDELNKAVISALPITLFCVHGNHEQRPYAIATYEEMEWRGGIVYVEKQYPNILFAKDGEIYDFDGKKVMVIGGAYSVDKFYRVTQGYAWFANEQPSDEIKAYVESQLEKASWQVDVVLSHTVPIKYEPVEEFLDGIDQSKVDKTTEIWLGELESKLTYDRWYAGHYHTSKEEDKLVIMYEDYRDLATGRLFPDLPVAGKPKYKTEQYVSFGWDGKVREGYIEVVDEWGTDYYYREQPTYDISVPDEGGAWYKHVPEEFVLEVID